MNLSCELSGAIRKLEQVLDDLSAGKEINVTDIEAKLYEWRSALYTATKGNDPLFDEYQVYEVELWGDKYRFKWPNDAFGSINSLYVSGGYLYATDVSVHDLGISPDNQVDLPNTFRHTTVCLGAISGFRCGSLGVSWVQASKTNLKRV